MQVGTSSQICSHAPGSSYRLGDGKKPGTPCTSCTSSELEAWRSHVQRPGAGGCGEGGGGGGGGRGGAGGAGGTGLPAGPRSAASANFHSTGAPGRGVTRARMCGTASTWMCVVLRVSAAIAAQTRPTALKPSAMVVLSWYLTWLGLGFGFGLGLGSGSGLRLGLGLG